MEDTSNEQVRLRLSQDDRHEFQEPAPPPAPSGPTMGAERWVMGGTALLALGMVWAVFKDPPVRAPGPPEPIEQAAVQQMPDWRKGVPPEVDTPRAAAVPVAEPAAAAGDQLQLAADSAAPEEEAAKPKAQPAQAQAARPPRARGTLRVPAVPQAPPVPADEPASGAPANDGSPFDDSPSRQPLNNAAPAAAAPAAEPPAAAPPPAEPPAATGDTADAMEGAP